MQSSGRKWSVVDYGQSHIQDGITIACDDSSECLLTQSMFTVFLFVFRGNIARIAC